MWIFKLNLLNKEYHDIFQKSKEWVVGVSMTATMSDGNFVFEGLVENISRTGFKMTDIPATFDPESSESGWF